MADDLGHQTNCAYEAIPPLQFDNIFLSAGQSINWVACDERVTSYATFQLLNVIPSSSDFQYAIYALEFQTISRN